MLKRMYQSLQNYGNDITVCDGSQTYSGKAFIAPLRYKNRVYIGNKFTESGINDGGRYSYIGPPDIRLDMMDSNTVVLFNGEEYCVKRAELFVCKNTPIYMWAVLVKKEGGDSFGDFLG